MGSKRRWSNSLMEVAVRPSAGAHGRQLRGEPIFFAAMLEQSAIEKILTHLDLQARAPLRAPARGPQLQAA